MFTPIPDGKEPNSEHPTELERKTEEERHRLGGAGVGFDGRKYRYKSFSYDKSSDALNYSRLDRTRLVSGSAPKDHPEWVEATVPTPIEQQQMKDLGITYDGKYYRYKEYRYDRVADAVNYAQLKH
jgi:hypothetical protein